MDCQLTLSNSHLTVFYDHPIRYLATTSAVISQEFCIKPIKSSAGGVQYNRSWQELSPSWPERCQSCTNLVIHVLDIILCIYQRQTPAQHNFEHKFYSQQFSRLSISCNETLVCGSHCGFDSRYPSSGG